MGVSRSLNGGYLSSQPSLGQHSGPRCGTALDKADRSAIARNANFISALTEKDKDKDEDKKYKDKANGSAIECNVNSISALTEKDKDKDKDKKDKDKANRSAIECNVNFISAAQCHRKRLSFQCLKYYLGLFKNSHSVPINYLEYDTLEFFYEA